MHGVEATADRWDLLAEHVVMRRLDLGLTSQQQLSIRSGISVTNIGRLERGIYRPGNSLEVIVKLQNALAWDVGSVKNILDGGRPIPLVDQSA